MLISIRYMEEKSEKIDILNWWIFMRKWNQSKDQIKLTDLAWRWRNSEKNENTQGFQKQTLFVIIYF